MKDLPSQLWDTETLAKVLGVDLSRIRYWLRIGALPHIKIGQLIRFDPNDIAAWVDRHKQNSGLGHEELRRVE